MRHGSDWYKREPTAYLGGVQGMTAKEHAVYSVTLDLIYAHGGAVNNDPAWIAGWIKDMGAAAVRKAIASLVERNKLIIYGSEITEKRAKNEAKTKENVSETARENGRKGGKKSAENRSGSSKNRGLPEAVAPSENQTEEIRGDKIEDKSSTSQEAADYQRYLKAHPKPVDSDAGAAFFSALLADGVEADRIIAAALAYAETVKTWSGDAKVQQSDNFLCPERGQWKKHHPKPQAVRASQSDILAFWAEKINGDKFVSPGSINAGLARELIGKGLVTPEKLKERGIAA